MWFLESANQVASCCFEIFEAIVNISDHVEKKSWSQLYWFRKAAEILFIRISWWEGKDRGGNG